MTNLMLGVGVFFMLSEFAQAQTAIELLAQAEKLAEQGDRYRAGPLFAKAEADFHAAGNTSQEFYAKFGRLHAESDHGNYKAVQAQIEHALTSPVVQNDPQLKIRALSVLGTVDLNIDTASAGSDWKQLLETATAVGDVKWENRAPGELGRELRIHSWAQGDGECSCGFEITSPGVSSTSPFARCSRR